MTQSTVFIGAIIFAILISALIVFLILKSTRAKNLKIIEICNLFLNSEYKLCHDKIEQFLRIHPSSWEIWLVRGNLGNEIRNHQMAKESFKKTLILKPNLPKALAGLGVVYPREKRYNLAEDYYYKALALDKDLYLAKSSLMLLELYKGNYEMAIILGEQSVQNGLKNVQLRIIENLMIAYHYAGNFDKRDQLFNYLQKREYSRLFALDVLFSEDISIEELMDD